MDNKRLITRMPLAAIESIAIYSTIFQYTSKGKRVLLVGETFSKLNYLFRERLSSVNSVLVDGLHIFPNEDNATAEGIVGVVPDLSEYAAIIFLFPTDIARNAEDNESQISFTFSEKVGTDVLDDLVDSLLAANHIDIFYGE